MARGALLAATACGGVAASLRRMKSNPCRNRAAVLHRAAQVQGGTRSKIASHPATGAGPAEKSKQFDRTCPANRRSPTGFLPPTDDIEVGTVGSCHQLNQTEHFRPCIADLVRQAYPGRSGSWAPVEMEAGCTQPSGSMRQRLQSMSYAPGSAGSSRASRATEPHRSRGCPLPRLQRGDSGFLGRQVGCRNVSRALPSQPASAKPANGTHLNSFGDCLLPSCTVSPAAAPMVGACEDRGARRLTRLTWPKQRLNVARIAHFCSF